MQKFIDFPPPTQPWQEFVESMPPGRAPTARDIFDRWDSPRYVCPSYPRNGNTDQKAQHDAESLLPGHCKCGAPFRKEGLRGLGEERAYRAWLAELMGEEERNYFWMTVAESRPAQVQRFAIVPALRCGLAVQKMLEGE